ncbi:MAG: sugar ABC transporter permease [Clostridia bacterium]|nr:sugar ABC transporter permease [Clostridia bacterium]
MHSVAYNRKDHLKKNLRMMRNHWQMYLIVLLPLVHIFIFKYLPIYGIQIAFKKWNPILGITGSQWVGLKLFGQFFSSPDAPRIIWNTLRISLIDLFIGFPMPIILALAVNACGAQKFRKTVQMITYAPHFISTVIMVGILMQITDMRLGAVNTIIRSLGFAPVNFMGSEALFPWLYVLSGVWQQAGYKSVMYIAALAGISPELHEAATVDGANRFQRMRHVDLPGILPTIVLMLILDVGSMLNVGYQKVYLMQNTMNMGSSEIISTYVYKVGLKQSNYGFSAAISLLNTIVSLVMVTSTNFISKRLTETSLW